MADPGTQQNSLMLGKNKQSGRIQPIPIDDEWQALRFIQADNALALLVDGSRAMSSALSMGSNAISGVTTLGMSGALSGGTTISISGALSIGGAISGATTIACSGAITSSLATGTAPIAVTSTTKCGNLNADQVDGVEGTDIFKKDGTVTATGSFNLGSLDITFLRTLAMSDAAANPDAVREIQWNAAVPKFYDTAARRIPPFKDTAPSSAQIPISDGTEWVPKTMSGDATIAATGALTLAGTIATNVNFTGALKVGGVTVFVQDATPTANATDDLWFETDTNILWYWNGTYWLTVETFHWNGSGEALAANTILKRVTARPSSGIEHDIWLIGITASVYAAATSDGSNYWTIALENESATTLASVATSGVSSNTYGLLGQSQGVLYDVSVLSTQNKMWRINTTKTGAPGLLYCGITVEYKLAHA